MASSTCFSWYIYKVAFIFYIACRNDSVFNSDTTTSSHLGNMNGGATAAPPPTPSTQTSSLSSSDAADTLSGLLHRLPPSLSLPTRRSPSTICPIISLSNENPTLLNDLLFCSSQLGFFQLTNHSIPSQLALSAESESLSLFNLTRDQKVQFFPQNWPLGFDDDDDGDGTGESFCLNASVPTESTELSLTSLSELARAMEKVGLEVIESLSGAIGFENPFREDPTRVCSLMMISEGIPASKSVLSGRFYPYVVGLQYQIRCQKHSLLADSGWLSVSPDIDSLMVTLGDITQVWSNGKLKKVRGRSGDGNTKRCITMSLLVTLPLDSIVSPLLGVSGGLDRNEDEEKEMDKKLQGKVFTSFAFEDYAWKLYHQKHLFKDPLDRYRL